MADVNDSLEIAELRLVVILDELEKVLEQNERPRQLQGKPLPEEVLASIRSVLLGCRRISFVLAGVTGVVRRHLHGPGDRLLNLLVEIELKTLDAGAAKALVCEPAAAVYAVTPSARDMLIVETNAHPYLIQLVCRELFEYMADQGRCRARRARSSRCDRPAKASSSAVQPHQTSMSAARMTSNRSTPETRVGQTGPRPGPRRKRCLSQASSTASASTIRTIRSMINPEPKAAANSGPNAMAASSTESDG